MVFEEVSGEVRNCRSDFSENVTDSFGNSVCEEFFDKLSDNISTAENFCLAADGREALIRVQLAELRLMI